MDKSLLRQQVLERLAEDLLRVEQVARTAHEAATHEEKIAEKKYDTLGLEASYLVAGQARCADAIRLAIVNRRNNLFTVRANKKTVDQRLKKINGVCVEIEKRRKGSINA